MATEETPPSAATDEVVADSIGTYAKTAKELENTVLLGRGKSHLNHQGNKHFQDLIVATVDAYAKEPSVFVKRQMTLKIVDQIEERGGFLRWSGKNGGCWETIDLEERRQKVAHALQYRIRCMNNTNGGKRARAKALNAVKNGPLTEADLLAVNSQSKKHKAAAAAAITTTTISASMKMLADLPATAAASLPAMATMMVVNTPTLPPMMTVTNNNNKNDDDGSVVVVVESAVVSDSKPSALPAAAAPLDKNSGQKPKDSNKNKETKKATSGGATAPTIIQLTKDERSFVRNFVNNPAGPTDDDDADDNDDDTEYDQELDNSSPAAVAAQLAAVSATVDTVSMPTLPGLSEAATAAADFVTTDEMVTAALSTGHVPAQLMATTPQLVPSAVLLPHATTGPTCVSAEAGAISEDLDVSV